jgi:hypothetical protein
LRKRIGTKLYDTDTAELLKEIEGGQLYQKRTRDREYFVVMDDGTIRPLDINDPFDVVLVNVELKQQVPQSDHVMIRVDRDTHTRITALAKRDGVSITEEVRRIISRL